MEQGLRKSDLIKTCLTEYDELKDAFVKGGTDIMNERNDENIMNERKDENVDYCQTPQ